jgi:type VI secretion system secreted protein Hcp
MATDIILEIQGLKGESEKVSNAMDVVSWNWGAANQGSWHDGGQGAGTGKGEVRDLTVTKYVDSATPNLMQACCTGEHFDKATLTLRKAGKKPLDYLTIEMKSVFVSNVETASSGLDDRFTENVSLCFAEVDVEYTPQTEKGSGGGGIKAGFNIQKGEAK